MTNINVNEFQKMLHAKRAELLSSSSSRDEIAIESSADEIDRLQQQINREVAIRTLDNTSRLLKGVQAALGRIEDDLYGQCLRCEEAIPEKRLKAIPWAAYCVGCQEIIDRESSFYNDGEDSIGFAA